MNETITATTTNIVTVDRRHCFRYSYNLDIGTLYFVQHEDCGLGLVNDYLGFDERKADSVFSRVSVKLVTGKLD